ncbi:MAG: WbqC family protein [Bacteroidetes bacterium]|nr:WbqC family protein [Bacteroidota bacterium]
MEALQEGILMSTAYLPPVSWMQEAALAKKVYIEANETYSKQSYRNRCKIMSANGILSLSIPVKKVHGNQTRTKDIEIFYGVAWQRIHQRALDAAYTSSPFYLYYKDELAVFFTRKFRFLLDLNMQMAEVISKMLGTDIQFELTDDYIVHPENIPDLRTSFSPKKTLIKNEFSPYTQVFEDRFGFVPDLSIVDLLFNEGPAAPEVLNKE